jgi:penicillin amidase
VKAGTIRRRILLALAAAAALLALALASAGLWLRGRMVACLPLLDGSVGVPGLGAPVQVTRDAQGAPTVSGSSRLDVARATGWLHAQDRFFQMDLLRRRAAGELAELVGKVAVPLDTRARMHAFRRLAAAVVDQTSPGERAILEAYCAGVNEGLASLGSKPWEYQVLRTEPVPWRPEDCALINYAMTLDLQDPAGNYIRSRAAVRDYLGTAALAYFDPLESPADAALDGSVGAAEPVPTPDQVNLRAAPAPQADSWRSSDEARAAGSNCFAASGRLTGTGSALLANDMHLRLGVPNIWYRVTLRWPGHEETGVMLPGAPPLVAGSTGRIAWGFTNSNAGTGDLVIVNPTISPEKYHGPSGQGLLPYEHRVETIRVRGSEPVKAEFDWTVFGPVVGDTPDGKRLAYHWTEDDPAATNLRILELEDAAGVDDAVAVAHRMGIPAQNFIVADAAGRIAWTVAGLLPRRVGYDGRLPVSWVFGDRRWDGYLPPGDVPTIVSPPDGILWTANNRTVGGPALAALGDSGYDQPARAGQIEGDLRSLAARGRPLTPADLLGVQLDDRAVMLAPWKAILEGALGPASVAARPARGALLRGLADWDGRAGAGSVSYRIVRTFRLAVAHRVLDPIFEPCADADPDFTWAKFNYEEPLRGILRARPENLLDRAFNTWDDLLAAAADDTVETYRAEGADPERATWGERNTAAIEHPFARAVPRWAAPWLRMPADPLAGDSNMPRIQDTDWGASERFAVSPGHEAEGIFHMPGGGTSNPCSPFFGAGHAAWVRGEPSPFLPGPAAHTLSLLPRPNPG